MRPSLPARQRKAARALRERDSRGSPLRENTGRHQSFLHREVIRWLRKTAVEAAHDYAEADEEPADFVFINGDHSLEGIRGAWEAWSGLVAPGGVIALHDSVSNGNRKVDDCWRRHH